MGGSMEQAKEVYKYFLDYCSGEDNAILNTLPKKPTLKSTISDKKKYFKCVAASPKQVRGPHPDFLLCDEVCETDDELIRSALPMVGTSDDSLVVMTSTFHKVFGIFQETWDSAIELGYKRYTWDIFDVIRVFDPAVWEDPILNRDIPDFRKLQEYSKDAAGVYRTGDADGWIPIENVIQAWREKPTLDWFEVEYLGRRPGTSGLVLNPIDVDASFFGQKENVVYNYIKDTDTSIGIDWGFSSMTSVSTLMKGRNDEKVVLDQKNYHQVRSEYIIKDVIDSIRLYHVRWVYCDAESAFENADLRNAIAKANLEWVCTVIEVPFGKEKPNMLGNLRAHFEKRKMKIPERFAVCKWQLKRYQYVEGTNKAKKKDDHIPDSFMCALQHWPLNRMAYRLLDSGGKDKMEKITTITSGLMDTRF